MKENYENKISIYIAYQEHYNLFQDGIYGHKK